MWSPQSWRERVALQQVDYPDAAALEVALATLRDVPPLVTSWEVEALRADLAKAAAGEAFLLQAGDCAERFADCRSDVISAQLKIILQMGLVLAHGTEKPVIRVGRWAGQYVKPRSQAFETRDGQTLLSYRGDAIHQLAFGAAARVPDPNLLVRAYERSAMTLNFLRALVARGFADLESADNWDLSFASGTPHQAEFARVVDSLRASLRVVSAATGQVAVARRVDLFTSHEGLSLPYESALTRAVPRRTGYYNLSTHFPWIGMRTADIEGAHVEFHRGLRNPIGIKIGPQTTPDALLALVERLDPEREPGRMTIIHRLGVQRVADTLPPLVRAMQNAGRRPLWVCDPMHGNTEFLANGYKTRRFENIVGEIAASIAIHRDNGSMLGGIHVEVTGDNVTECTGGARGLVEADLERAYRTAVDPRLNVEQALELSFQVARLVGRGESVQHVACR